MKPLSVEQLDQITRTKHGDLPDVCIRAEDGLHFLPFYQLEPGEEIPENYVQVSVMNILMYLADLKGLLHPAIDVRHGDPVRAAQQVVEALRQLD